MSPLITLGCSGSRRVLPYLPVTRNVAALRSRLVTSSPMASPVRIPVAAISAIRVWKVAARIAGRNWSAAASRAWIWSSP